MKTEKENKIKTRMEVTEKENKNASVRKKKIKQ